ncbi:MAG: MFS transporter [Actinomycetota bacterium]|nr:MFS transporter [Actinomycetota bacterium]
MIGRGRWWALGGVTLAVLAVGMDLTILSVALPTLARVLKASEADLEWFSSGYALVLAAVMLPAGLVGDRYGRKKVLLGSLSSFALGSAACAYSRSAAMFIAARVVLGFAGAGIIVMAASAVAVLFSEEERPKAVGIWAAANMVAFPVGPILGGWLLAHYWWGWVFLINVPVALVGIAAVSALVPESSSIERPGLDVVGLVASGAGLVALTYGFIASGYHGWGAPATIGPLVAGAVILAGFFAWEHTLGSRPAGRPLVDLSLFESASFTWGVILFALLTLALVGVLFTLPQYFQGVVGSNPEGSGIRLLPIVGGLLVGVLPASVIARRIGAKLAVAAGFAVLGLGLAIGATTTAGSGEAFNAIWVAVVGLGTGLTMATAASTALVELDEEHAGIGSAVLQALKNTGAPLGSAILGGTLSAVYTAHLHLAGVPPAAAAAARQSVFGGLAVAHDLHSASLAASVRGAFIHGMDVALVVSAGIAAAGVVLALAFLPSRRRPAGDLIG